MDTAFAPLVQINTEVVDGLCRWSLLMVFHTGLMMVFGDLWYGGDDGLCRWSLIQRLMMVFGDLWYRVVDDLCRWCVQCLLSVVGVLDNYPRTKGPSKPCDQVFCKRPWFVYNSTNGIFKANEKWVTKQEMSNIMRNELFFNKPLSKGFWNVFDNFSQNISFVRNSLLENLCFPEDRETVFWKTYVFQKIEKQ